MTIIPIVTIVVIIGGIFGYSNYEKEVNVLIDDTKNEIESLDEKISEIQDELTKENTEIQNVNEEHEKEKEWKDAMKKDYTFSNSVNQNLGEPIEITESDIEDIRLKFHNLVNEERKKKGKSSLVLDEKINVIAQDYADYLSKHNHFTHEDLDGNNSENRLKSVCSGWKGENIGSVFLISQDKASDMLKGLKSSKGHYNNAMNENFVREGLGFAVSNDLFIMVQNFC